MAEAEDGNSVMHDDVIINLSAAYMDRATKKGKPHRLQDFRTSGLFQHCQEHRLMYWGMGTHPGI